MSKTVRVHLPQRFYDDHVGRGLPSGTEVSRNSRQVVVDLDAAGYTDLLADADFYLDGGVAEFGREMLGLLSSANATALILRTTPPPE